MTIDVSAISTAFSEFGGAILKQKMTKWDLGGDFFLQRNVTAPRVLPKLTPGGGPIPYAKADGFTGNEPIVTDRTLTVHQSKWDFELDLEELRNTYLSQVENGDLDPAQSTFVRFVLEFYAEAYLNKIYTGALASGTYNSAGTTTAAVMTGVLTKIAALITSADIAAGQVIATGASTSANAVTKVELLSDGIPVWMKQMGFKILCSYDQLAKYRNHYRTLNGFGFDKNEKGKYSLDGVNGYIKPCGWLNTSGRMIAVPDTTGPDAPLQLGVNDSAVKLYTTPHLNIIQNRLVCPIGFEISDAAAIYVNDQA